MVILSEAERSGAKSKDLHRRPNSKGPRLSPAPQPKAHHKPVILSGVSHRRTKPKDLQFAQSRAEGASIRSSLRHPERDAPHFMVILSERKARVEGPAQTPQFEGVPLSPAPQPKAHHKPVILGEVSRRRTKPKDLQFARKPRRRRTILPHSEHPSTRAKQTQPNHQSNQRY